MIDFENMTENERKQKKKLVWICNEKKLTIIKSSMSGLWQIKATLNHHKNICRHEYFSSQSIGIKMFGIQFQLIIQTHIGIHSSSEMIHLVQLKIQNNLVAFQSETDCHTLYP